jgi:hypothetical protein
VLRDTRVHAQHSAVPSRLVPPSTPIPGARLASVDRPASHAAVFLAVSQVSKQPAPRFQLQLCDDEKCVFEDVVNGAIMGALALTSSKPIRLLTMCFCRTAKLVTKKVVRLRFEESPKSVMVVKKLNDRGGRHLASSVYLSCHAVLC